MIFQSYNVIDILAVCLSAVISITLHEYAHGFIALKNGDPTAKYNGRLTLNPIKHFDPIGFFMLVVAGFGFAKPVPVNPNNFRKLRRGIFTVAIAGIVTNLILSFICVAFALLINRFYSGNTSEFLYLIVNFFYLFFLYMSIINVSLAIFNLLPLYPLDGFRVLESATRYSNPVTKFLRNYGTYILIALIGIGVIIDLFNVRDVAPIFYYFDVLGLYINVVGGGIRSAFIWFWGLLI